LAKRIVDTIETGTAETGAASRQRGAASILRVSQAELARMLGVSREFVNKQLVTWRDAGIIELGRRRLVVRDREALEQLAGL